jgi:hypothetical protein
MVNIDALYKTFRHGDTIAVQDTILAVIGKVDLSHECNFSVYDKHGVLVLSFFNDAVKSIDVSTVMYGGIKHIELTVKFVDDTSIRLC